MIETIKIILLIFFIFVFIVFSIFARHYDKNKARGLERIEDNLQRIADEQRSQDEGIGKLEELERDDSKRLERMRQVISKVEKENS